MAIEIVDFPIKNGGSFHSYVSHYQRVPQSMDINQGLVTVPFWEYWTSPEKVAV